MFKSPDRLMRDLLVSSLVAIPLIFFASWGMLHLDGVCLKNKPFDPIAADLTRIIPGGKGSDQVLSQGVETAIISKKEMGLPEESE